MKTLITILAICLSISVEAATYTVSNTFSFGTSSLRDAITQANANTNTGPHLINFSIPGNTVHTLFLATNLPIITRPMVINGYSQPGAASNTLAQGNNAILRIALNGTNAGDFDGFDIGTSNCTIMGISIGHFDKSGIRVNGDNNNIWGNFIGTDASGLTPLGNRLCGVAVYTGSGNVIGGTNPGARNLSSGSACSGVLLESVNNRVQGNFIGTDRTGTNALANLLSGVEISGGRSNLVGGATAGARNVISGNERHGVEITDDSERTPFANIVQGNFIGTEVTGMRALPNGDGGAVIDRGRFNLIGSTNAAGRNVLSGNGGVGVGIGGGESNVVQGNFIGVASTGTNALPNWEGVALELTDRNIVGGTETGAGNIICASSFDGIHVLLSNENTIQGNLIGVDATGLRALGNQASGIYLDLSFSNLIGGTSATARNIVSGNGFAGIEDDFGFENIVQGNFVGVDVTGTRALGNLDAGIILTNSGSNLIGGTTAGSKNVISGNGRSGITLLAGSDNNIVQGNFVGTDATGMNALPNGSGTGLSIYSGISIISSPGNQIGGAIAGAGNLISGNANDGLLIFADSPGTLVEGNQIGTDVTGTRPLPNNSDGIRIDSSGNNLIGGTTPGAGNLISGNGQSGVFLTNPGTQNNRIQGNRIGTAADGSTPLGNGAHGVFLATSVANNSVGGSAANAGNIIAFNAGDGVLVGQTPPFAPAGRGNALLSNRIFANGGLGIDLGPNGITPNDAGDADSGPNALQNFPILTGGNSDASGAVVQGRLESTPNTTFTLQFYASFTADPSGYGEGEQLIATITSSTDDTGQGEFSVNLPESLSGRWVSATATSPANDTSEFSTAIQLSWLARYNGPASSQDEASAIVVDGAGNIYVTGVSSGLGGDTDYATVKYNAAGAQVWVARYDGAAGRFDRATALAVDSAGHVHVTGGSDGTNGRSDYLTVKYSAAGAELWTARYDGPDQGYDLAKALAIDSAGNVHVTGYSQGPDGFDYATARYDADGNRLWLARYNGPEDGDDSASSLALGMDGDLFVTGSSKTSQGGTDIATIHYSRSGSSLWSRRFSGPASPSDSRPAALARDPDGNIVVTGYSQGSGSGYDFVTIKYSRSGQELWAARYNGPANGDDQAAAIAVDDDGNVHVTGLSYGSGTDADYAIIKYGPAGQQLWVARYDGPESGYDAPKALALDGQGNVIVTGVSVGDGTGADYATVKYSSSGTRLSSQRYNGPAGARDVASAVALDGDGSVFVTGRSDGAGTDSDYATIKYLLDSEPSFSVSGTTLRLDFALVDAGGVSNLHLKASPASRPFLLQTTTNLVTWITVRTIPAGEPLDQLVPTSRQGASSFYRLLAAP